MGNMCMTPIERIHYEYTTKDTKHKQEQQLEQERKFKLWLKSDEARIIKTELTKDLKQSLTQNVTVVEFSGIVYELARDHTDSEIAYLLNSPGDSRYIKITRYSTQGRRFIELNTEFNNVKKIEQSFIRDF
jgi:ABC-type Zn2+ transport system substrate-binding protein/surface adhesin